MAGKQLSAAECQALESLIDCTSLATVLGALAEICAEKAQHVQDNWQDSGLAAHWQTQCNRIERVASACQV